MLRLGPYGDAFGARPDGLTLRAAQGRTARHRPRPAAAPAARGAAHPVGPDRTGARAADRRRAPGCGTRCGPRRRRVRPDRPPASALQQQLDAQRARAGRRHQPLHAADPSRRRRRTRHRPTPPWIKGPGGEVVAPVEMTDGHPAAASCRCRTAGVTTAAAPGWASRPTQPGVNVNQLNDGRCSTRCRAPPFSTDSPSSRPGVSHRTGRRPGNAKTIGASLDGPRQVRPGGQG